MQNGEVALSYSELAERLEMPNRTGQGLGPILDDAAALCIKHGLPDVSSVIVTKDSIENGQPMPSLDSFQDGVWPITGVSIEDVPALQNEVREFDWAAVKQLGLN